MCNGDHYPKPRALLIDRRPRPGKYVLTRGAGLLLNASRSRSHSVLWISFASVRKRRESSREILRVSDVRPRMLLLGCASQDALAPRLPQGPVRRPSQGCGPSDDQVNAPTEMVSSVQSVGVNELAGTESSLELVRTESPLKLVGIESTLELVETENPLELVRTENLLELVGTESSSELVGT
ncbi:hypothetical protein GW17_00034759 [Ensete ventricosum]|nr:hypothetical protein GW17_00034759 [Ensete ventricosum]